MTRIGQKRFLTKNELVFQSELVLNIKKRDRFESQYTKYNEIWIIIKTQIITNYTKDRDKKKKIDKTHLFILRESEKIIKKQLLRSQKKNNY